MNCLYSSETYKVYTATQLFKKTVSDELAHCLQLNLILLPGWRMIDAVHIYVKLALNFHFK